MLDHHKNAFKIRMDELYYQGSTLIQDHEELAWYRTREETFKHLLLDVRNHVNVMWNNESQNEELCDRAEDIRVAKGSGRTLFLFCDSLMTLDQWLESMSATNGGYR